MTLDLDRFRRQLDLFRELVAYNDQGHPFVSFGEGVAAAWEDYKPRLREVALEQLQPASWQEHEVGSGAILERAIAAIEINEPRRLVQNNLVFWQNRFGHANRAHRALLDARSGHHLRVSIERQLLELFQGSAEGEAFDRLAELAHRKYPLLAYLCFLKDMDRFAPILPTTFDRAFRDLGIDLRTERNCSWANYRAFDGALGEIRDALEEAGRLPGVRLIDAHSFCWLLERLDRPAPGQGAAMSRRGNPEGRVLGAREKSIWEMKNAVLETVKHARGQMEMRRVKVKELRMTERALEILVEKLLEQQEDRCALTGLPLEYRGTHSDQNLLPSLDRIDSSSHYEAGNLQIVCRFVNFWKGDSDTEEFARLMRLVRGFEE